jgi:glycosyltransferase involved in cell wall biosynthesis
VTWEIIVVDNNSTDDTRAVIEEFMHDAALPLRYRFETQQGAAYTRNNGVLAARGKVLVFIDDDEIVDVGWLMVVKSAFDCLGCAGIGGRVLPRWLERPPDWFTTEGPYRIIGPIQDHNLGDVPKAYTVDSIMPLGGNLAIRRECFEKHGLFRTDLGPVGTGEYRMGEDTEFCLRLIRSGERLVYVPTAVTFNLVHPQRLTKRFCRRFYFRLGQSKALFQTPESGMRRIVGVPRHLLKRFAELAWAWAGAVLRGGSSARLYFVFQVSHVMGEIYQHLSMRCRNDSA